MGWMYTSKPKGQSVKDFIQKQWGDNLEILDCKVKKFRTAYMAVKDKKTGEVFACVCLLDYRPNDYPYEFGYKDMEETSGPCSYECPESILKLLTPIDSEYANEWRKTCWEIVNQKKNRPKVRAGDIVVFDEAINYSGVLLKEFKVYKLRRNLFSRKDGQLYRIRNWRERKYKVKV